MAIVTILAIETNIHGYREHCRGLSNRHTTEKDPSDFRSKRMGASALIIPPGTPDGYVCSSPLLYR